jgi:hypothetical protein
MSPTNLQGLDLVSPTQPSDSFPTDSHDSQDLLNLSYFPELNAQLHDWTNLAFESDEPVHLNDKKTGGDEATQSIHSVEDDEEDDADDGKPAQADNHDNVVVANPVPPRPTQPRTATRSLTAFDIGSLLAGFGVDPFVVPPMQSSATTPSLAQILSLYPNAAYPHPQSSASGEDNSQPSAAKRARVRRPSAGTSDHSNDGGNPANEPLNDTPLTAAEDKRRRNTAASARFRMKKKEREATLEKKSKELEMRVNELERECEGLRRENGWLKGLVVGVTGAGASQQAASATAGVKRPREDVDGVGKK